MIFFTRPTAETTRGGGVSLSFLLLWILPMDLQSLNDELRGLRNQGVPLANLTQVARGLGIRPATARAWAEQGRCPALWIVGRWKSHADIMRRWLDAEESQRQPKPGRKTTQSVRKNQILKAESQLKSMGVL